MQGKDYKEKNMPMNAQTIETAVALSAADDEFSIFAIGWTGFITIVSGGDSWTLSVTAGSLARTQAATSAQADSSDDVVISAAPGDWGTLLEEPPPPGYVDFAAAATIGAFTVLPPP